MAEERDARFEREPRVRLPSTETWAPFGSTLDEEPDAAEPARPATDSVGPLDFHERYELLGTLAYGSMAEIRLCKDRPFAREVAMKVLRNAPSARSARWRFVREARVQGQLSHPAVVPTYDLGIDPSGDLYFTMKWVRGLRLDRALAELSEGAERPAFSERQLLSRFSQLCLALEYAHCRGVVHRDLKPSNIMLGEFGEVYVLDWGLAKVLTESQARYEPIDDASGAMRTSDGSVLGTIGYMAPEQLQGEVDRVTTRADVYSLGAMLFELLAREPLHRGSAAIQALSSLKTDGASPRERREGVPEGLDELCFAALRADPEQRLESAKAIADAIDAHLSSGP
ncbi:MAG: serine/threonine protein kinase [Sandaracinaceae bacterium]|nr:serine/threonine protein kinase [Sandaracinaceae bacterium]